MTHRKLIYLVTFAVSISLLLGLPAIAQPQSDLVSIDQAAGWRYLDVNYRPSSSFVYSAAQSGLLLGVNFNLKQPVCPQS
jgi:hypothetical protein